MKINIKIKMFILENKIMLILLFLSLLIVAKTTQFPYLCFPCIGLEHLMQAPPANTKMYDFWDISKNLSLAFITSFIFYILVDYIPFLKNENRAFSFIKNDLFKLQVEIIKLLSLYAYYCGIRKRLFYLLDEDIENFETVELIDSIKNYSYIMWDSKTNKILSKKRLYCRSFYDSIKEHSEKIQDLLREIMNKPLAAYYGQNLLEAFTVIRENKLLSIYDNDLFKIVQKSSYSLSIDNFKVNFSEAFLVARYFRNYNLRKIDYEIKELIEIKKD